MRGNRDDGAGFRSTAFSALKANAVRPSFSFMISASSYRKWVFHQAEKELKTLPALRYHLGHRKGRLKSLSMHGFISRREGPP